MRRKAVRAVRFVAAGLFLALGVAGLFLPFLQGVLFIVIGLAILAPEWPWAGRQVARIRARHPRLAERFDEGRRLLRPRGRR